MGVRVGEAFSPLKSADRLLNLFADAKFGLFADAKFRATFSRKSLSKSFLEHFA